MFLFTPKKSVGVQSCLLRLVNNYCPELGPLFENRRVESRVPVCVVTLVVPLLDGKPHLEQYFPTVTKEFSTTGVSIVLDQPRGLADVILVFRTEENLVYMKGTARHLNPMGAGFFHLGIELETMVRVEEYPELQDLHI